MTVTLQPSKSTAPEEVPTKTVEVSTERVPQNAYNNSIYSIYSNKPEPAFPEPTPLLNTHFEPTTLATDLTKLPESTSEAVTSLKPTEVDQYEISYVPVDRKTEGPNQTLSGPQTGPAYNFIPNEVPRPIVNESDHTETSVPTTTTTSNKASSENDLTPEPPTRPSTRVVFVDVGKETATVKGEKAPDGSVFVDTNDVPSNEWTKISQKPADCQIGFQMDEYGACFGR